MKYLKQGILTSYQNLGKNGLRHLGINPSGVMDRLSARILNITLQNNEDENEEKKGFP